MNPLIAKIRKVQKDVKDINNDGVIEISYSHIQVNSVKVFKQVITDKTPLEVIYHGGYLHIAYYDKENDVTWTVLV